MKLKIDYTIWELNEYVITLNGKPVGACVHKEEAEQIKRWLPSALKEIVDKANTETTKEAIYG